MRVLWHQPVLALPVAAALLAGPPRRAGDPALLYATFLGTSSQDSIIGVKADSTGMVYVVGYTDSGDLPALPGAYQDVNRGGRDIFIAKLNPALSGPESLVYFTYLGGSGADTPIAMTVDAAGNVYVAGSTTSTDFPVSGQAPQTTNGGGTDAFVVMLNPAIPGEMALAFSTYLGGAQTDVANAVAVDAARAIYVAGYTRSENLPLAGSPVQEGRWGDEDGFVAKLNPYLPAPDSRVYTTYLGGGLNDRCWAIAVSAEGLVYVAGSTYSGENFPVVGNVFQPVYSGNGDIFLTVLNLARPGYDALAYSTFLGGSSIDEVRKLALTPDGGVLLTGYTLSTDFPVTPDAYQREAPGNGDVFVSKLNPRLPGETGLVYSTYLGGHSSEVAYDILGDAQNNVYLTGYTLSGDFPVTPDALQPEWSGGVDVFCAKLSLAMPPAQALAYATFAGHGGISVGYGIAVSPSGEIYLAGRSQDQSFPVTANALQQTYAGGFSDGFLLVLGKQ